MSFLALQCLRLNELSLIERSRSDQEMPFRLVDIVPEKRNVWTEIKYAWKKNNERSEILTEYVCTTACIFWESDVTYTSERKHNSARIQLVLSRSCFEDGIFYDTFPRVQRVTTMPDNTEYSKKEFPVFFDWIVKARHSEARSARERVARVANAAFFDT